MAAAKSAGLSGMDGFEALRSQNQRACYQDKWCKRCCRFCLVVCYIVSFKETIEGNTTTSTWNWMDSMWKLTCIDFIKSMEDEKKQGKNSIEAFGSIMDMVVGEDKRYCLKSEIENSQKWRTASLNRTNDKS